MHISIEKVFQLAALNNNFIFAYLEEKRVAINKLSPGNIVQSE